MPPNAHPARQSGLTLTQTLAVLGVSSFIIVGLITQQAMNDSNLNTATVDVLGVVQAVRRAYAHQPNFNGLSVAMLDQLNAAPKGWPAQGAGVRKNPFGGVVVMGPAEEINAGDSFFIAFTHVPKLGCTALVQILAWQGGGVVVSRQGKAEALPAAAYAAGFTRTSPPALVAGSGGCGGVAPFTINARFGSSAPVS